MGDNAKSKDKNKALIAAQEEMTEEGMYQEYSIQQSNRPYYITSTSPIIKTFGTVLTGGKGFVGEIPDRVETSTKGKNTVSISSIANTNNKGLIIAVNHSNGDTDAIHIKNKDKLISGKNFQLFNYIITLLLGVLKNQGDTPISDHITIVYAELVKIGLYKTEELARKRVAAMYGILKDTEFYGSTSRGKKQIKNDKEGVLFWHKDTSHKGIALFYLNYKANWDFIFQFYAPLPLYFFSLKPNTAKLAYCIFDHARQSISKISKKGVITISYREIIESLALPQISKAMNIPNQIVKPIEAAIEEIENVNDENLFIHEVYDENMSSTERLEKGYVEITFTGSYLEYFIGIDTKTKKRIADKQKRKEQRIKQNVQKKLEAATAADQSEEGQSSAPQSDTQSKDTQ